MAHKRARQPINSKKFIESYLRNDFNWQVAEELGITVGAANSKAATLRTKGVKLPPRFPRDDVDELNRAIAEIERQMKSKD